MLTCAYHARSIREDAIDQLPEPHATDECVPVVTGSCVPRQALQLFNVTPAEDDVVDFEDGP